MKTKNIGFIGGGNMASSLLNGLIASGHLAKHLWVLDTNQNVLDQLNDKLNVNVTMDNQHLISQVDVVVLAVKPQMIKSVSQSIAPFVQNKKTLVVSIAAGINQTSLQSWLGENVAIVRCMPNTPALVLTGATALHANQNVSEEQYNLAENILRSVGIALWVEKETELDTVTAVSGSGPAYYFLMMEAMIKTAIELGLDPNTAQLLVQQTALGAAKIALESEESPDVLRQRVTSPNGTTERAINIFNQGNFIDLVSKALYAAHDRSVELSKENEV